MMLRRDESPNVEAVPERSKHSLIVTGTPASGGSFSPRETARSTSAAVSLGLAKSSTVIALSLPSTVSRRPMKCSKVSAAESSRAAMRRAISRADKSAISFWPCFEKDIVPRAFESRDGGNAQGVELVHRDFLLCVRHYAGDDFLTPVGVRAADDGHFQNARVPQ